VRNAEFMKNELRVSVPDSIIDRMSKAPNADAARAEGIEIAREMLHQVRGLVQGAQVAAPLGRYSSAVQVLDGMGSAGSAAAKV
jgi:methionine synthase / methylenetetrahydrofolate reductase(NADPH)